MLIGVNNVNNVNVTKTTKAKSTGIKQDIINNKGLTTDKVALGNANPKDTGEAKMVSAANKILTEQLNLQKGQPVVIKADKEYLPFVKIMVEEAYKKHSGEVNVQFKEPELENLQKKYCKEPDFEYKKKQEQYFQDKGAAIITFDKKNSPFKMAGLSNAEVEAVKKPYDVKLPKDVQAQVNDAFNPKEVFETLLNAKKGQPIRVIAEREHEPNVLRFAEYAYKNGSGPIEVTYTEPNSVLSRAKLQYADESVLEEVPQHVVDSWTEKCQRNTAALIFQGEDPQALAGIDPKRIMKNAKARSSVISQIRKSYPEAQWNIYYAPTTKSAAVSYPEYSDKYEALKQAATDAKDINRCGKLEAHATRLNEIADKMNSLNIDKIHFVSVDPKTKQPDGKTDLYIGMTKKSMFRAATKETDDGIKYMANTPTEEVFSSPDRTRTEGWVSTTLPLSLNGNLIDGIRMRFEKGKAVEVYAEKNQELWQEHVKSAEGADMLGEIALVAESPIFKTGRVFQDTLLDENAACHIAIGSGFDDCVKGAEDIKDIKERQEFLKKNNINDSTIHTDFMIGGPNVIVEGITADGKTITLIKDNKYQI